MRITLTLALTLALSLGACGDKDGELADGDDLYEPDGASDGSSGDAGDGETDGETDGDDGDDDCWETASGCDELGACFTAVSAEIRSCDDATECGQVLEGTSCGCTRELVARTDADPTAFYDLLRQGQAAGCDWATLGSPCDCPEADGFACDDGVCTWSWVTP